MNQAVADKWNTIYQSQTTLPTVAEVLKNNAFLLPESGVALDVACGLGGNALFLAEHGLNVQATDISAVAIEKLSKLAAQKNLIIQAQCVDLQKIILPKQTFDVIVVSHFLDRAMCHGIIDSLKREGVLFYQTYTQQKLSHSPPHHPAFLLAENELLKLFSALHTVFYQEHGRVGDLKNGERNRALYIGQKR